MGRIITGTGIYVVRISLRMFQTGGNATDLIDNNKSLNTRPSLDLYYFRKLPRKQSLAVNVVGTYSNTDSRHTYREELESIPLTDIYTKVDGKRYSVIGEGIYEKELETGRISAGLKHTQAYTDNVYSGSGDYTTHMTESESYMYAQYVGKSIKGYCWFA
jgi:hypothetical protein